MEEDRMGAVALSIEELLLDSENPRIDSADSQRDALQKILDDQGEKLFELAQDIADEGLSPIERLLVVSEDNSSDRYIAMEGNRRVASLKILSNPNVLSGIKIETRLRRKFENLASTFDKSTIEPIDAFLADTRETGKKWIYLRHTGENEGRGVVSWNGIAAARFRGEDPALQALEFVRAHGNLTETQRTLLSRFPITTLDRLLSNPAVRKVIGVDVKSNKLITGLPASEVMKPLTRIVVDLAEKRTNVSKLKSRDQQIEYVNAFGSDEKPDIAKAGAPRPIEALTAGDFIRKAPPKRILRSTVERRTVVPKRLKLNVSDAKTAGILRELQFLHAEQTPNAGAVLLRVFLELSVDSYLVRNQLSLQETTPGGKKDKKLAKKVKEAIDHMVTQGGASRKDFLSVTRGLTDSKSPISIDLLHAYIHNRFTTPKSRELLAAWDDAQPLIERIWP
jgi:hypothetical protein